MVSLQEQVVFVTGANGFLGSHVVKQLLLAGYRVRGTLRNIEDRGDIVEALKNLVPNVKHELELVDVDLLCDDGWDSAMFGCSSVIHTAGPFLCSAEKHSDDYFEDHYVNGSLRVLRAAVRAGVTKVVMTSTIGTVLAGGVPLTEGNIYTEENWTDLNEPNLSSFDRAKVMAEKAAWNFVSQLPEENKLTLTTLLPETILGPPLLKPRQIAGPVEVINSLMNHVYPGCLNLMGHYSDVRDVAQCHIKSLNTPAAENQRIILVSTCEWMPEVTKIIAKEFRPQGYTIYTNTLPTFMLWLPSIFDKRIEKSGIVDRIGKNIYFSTDKMNDIFKLKPRPLKDSVIEMIYRMIDLGITYKAKKYRPIGSRATQATA